MAENYKIRESEQSELRIQLERKIETLFENWEKTKE
jgi:hypothetical protein